MPQAEPLHPAPETFQLTAWLGLELGSGVRVAVNWAIAPVATEVGPLTAKVKLLVTVTEALAAFEGSAMLRAVSVTLEGTGRILGAV